MKTASITIIKKRFFVIALMIAILFTSLQPTAVHAATTRKTTTKSYTPMSAEGAFGLVCKFRLTGVPIPLSAA